MANQRCAQSNYFEVTAARQHRPCILPSVCKKPARRGDASYRIKKAARFAPPLIFYEMKF